MDNNQKEQREAWRRFITSGEKELEKAKKDKDKTRIEYYKTKIAFYKRKLEEDE